MDRMTRKDLDNLFSLRARIERAESMLASLRARSNPGAQVLTGMPHATGTQDKTGDYAMAIVSLEERIQNLYNELRQQERRVCDFLAGIEDEYISTALLLRYVHGLLWKEVAYAVGKSKKSITNQCYEYLNSLDEDDAEGHRGASGGHRVAPRGIGGTPRGTKGHRGGTEGH